MNPCSSSNPSPSLNDNIPPNQTVNMLQMNPSSSNPSPSLIDNIPPTQTVKMLPDEPKKISSSDCAVGVAEDHVELEVTAEISSSDITGGVGVDNFEVEVNEDASIGEFNVAVEGPVIVSQPSVEGAAEILVGGLDIAIVEEDPQEEAGMALEGLVGAVDVGGPDFEQGAAEILVGGLDIAIVEEDPQAEAGMALEGLVGAVDVGGPDLPIAFENVHGDADVVFGFPIALNKDQTVDLVRRYFVRPGSCVILLVDSSYIRDLSLRVKNTSAIKHYSPNAHLFLAHMLNVKSIKLLTSSCVRSNLIYQGDLVSASPKDKWAKQIAEKLNVMVCPHFKAGSHCVDGKAAEDCLLDVAAETNIPCVIASVDPIFIKAAQQVCMFPVLTRSGDRRTFLPLTLTAGPAYIPDLEQFLLEV